MTKAWLSFRDRLLADLDGIERDLLVLLDISTIRYVNPNTSRRTQRSRPSVRSGPQFLGDRHAPTISAVARHRHGPPTG